jgi:hypothetical protein
VHLVWQFERVGSKVHYISLKIDDVIFNLNRFQAFEAGWPMQDIDVAFQMDGNFEQAPYNVWLDQMTLRAW